MARIGDAAWSTRIAGALRNTDRRSQLHDASDKAHLTTRASGFGRFLQSSDWQSRGMTMSDFYTLTKTDIAAMRQCDHLVVRRDPAPLVYCIKNAKRSEHDPFGQDIRFNIAVPVIIGHDWRYDVSHCTAFNMIWNYPTQITQTGCILATLRVGDEIRFVFMVDGHSTQAMEDAGFHGDVLKLEVRRGGKLVADWDLAVSICQNNTARMVKGAVLRREAA